MASAYPNVIPSFTTKVDQVDVNWAADINRLQDETAALAVELGTVPKAGFANVAARLQHLQDTKSDVGHNHDERYLRRSLATTKGVLVVSTGANDFTGLSPGTLGQSLISDPGLSAGVRWTTLRHDMLPGLSNDDHPHYLTTERHSGTDHTSILNSLTVNVFGDISTATPNVGDVLKWTGSEYAPLPDDDTNVHGDLGGLEEDDHPQYFNDARHTRAVHDALELTHNSLSGLTTGNPHTQYASRTAAATISGAWNYTTRPTVAGQNVTSGVDGTRQIFVRTGTPTSPANGDLWFRP